MRYGGTTSTRERSHPEKIDSSKANRQFSRTKPYRDKTHTDEAGQVHPELMRRSNQKTGSNADVSTDRFVASPMLRDGPVVSPPSHRGLVCVVTPTKSKNVENYFAFF